MGTYGGNFTTPHLDRLASEGITHDRAYSNAALCVPTRYICLTGQYASRSKHPLYQPSTSQAAIANGTFFIPETKTIAQSLRAAGYYTGVTGKWHNMSHEKKIPGHPSNITGSLPKNADPKNPEVISQLKKVQEFMAKELDSFGFDSAAYLTDGNLSYYPDALAHHNIEYTVKGAVDFLEKAPKKKPFFLWTAFTTTHGPREPIQSGDVRMTPEGYTEKHLGLMPSRKEILATCKKKSHTMETTMAWMDAGIGVILNKLEQLGQADNTLVIFLADQQNTGKSTPYECGVNIPFLAKWPDVIKANSRSETLIDTADMAATILNVAKAKPMEGVHLDGLNILPVWQGKKSVLKKTIFTEMGQTKGVITKNWKYIAIRYEPKLLEKGFNPPRGGKIKDLAKAGAFKMLRNSSPFGQAKRIGFADPDQLYDLRSDPLEKKNLAKNPENKRYLEEMKSELSLYIKDLGRDFGEFDLL